MAASSPHRGLTLSTDVGPRTAAPALSQSSDRQVNVRLLLVSVFLLCSTAITVYWWHGRQLERQANVFLDAATAAENEENWAEAFRCLRQYLNFRPTDPDALARLANAADESAGSEEERQYAIGLLAEALDYNPQRRDLQLRLADLLPSSQPHRSLELANKLLDNAPNHPQALRIRAIAMDRLWELSQSPDITLVAIANAYIKAMDANPGNLELSLRLATIYQEHADELARLTDVDSSAWRRRVDRILGDAIRQSDDKAQAHLARYFFRLRYPVQAEKGESPKTAEPAAEDAMPEDLAQALEADPDNLQVRLAVAGAISKQTFHEPLIQAAPSAPLSESQRAIVEGHLEVAMRQAPNDPRPYLGLSRTKWQAGDRQGAIDILVEGMDPTRTSSPTVLTRLLELLIADSQWEKAQPLLDRLERLVRQYRAVSEGAKVADRLDATFKLLTAQWLLIERNPQASLLAASRLLREVCQADLPEYLTAIANYQLASCASRMEQWDLAVASYQKAAAAAPYLTSVRTELADALNRAGRYDEAIAEYEHLLVVAGDNPSSATLVGGLAGALLAKQLLLPAERRNWEKFDKALQKAQAVQGESPLPMFLHWEATLARSSAGKRPSWPAEFQQAKAKYGERPDFWSHAFELGLRLGELDQAVTALEQLERLTGQATPGRRARLELARGNLAAADSLLKQELAERGADAPPLPPAQRRALLTMRAELATITGRFDEARGIWGQLADEDPQDPAPQFQLALIAAQTKNMEELTSRIAALRSLEGDKGSLHCFCQIQLYLLSAAKGDGAGLTQAASAARDLSTRRPTWRLSRVAEGLVAEAMGQHEDAISAYRHAFALGERAGSLSRKLALLLALQRRYDQAVQHLDQLSEPMLLSEQMLPIAVRLLLQQKQVERALTLVEKGIALAPRNSEFHVVLGQALLASDRPDRLTAAANAFRRGAELAPGDVLARLSLLDFYLSNEGPNRTAGALNELNAITQLLESSWESRPRAVRAMLLARLLQLHGAFSGAASLYRAAVQEGLDDSLGRNLMGRADVTADLRPVDAASLTGLFHDASDDARRTLAVALAASPLSAEQSHGEALLEQSRWRALAMFCRGGPHNRRKAIDMLRDSIDHSTKTDGSSSTPAADDLLLVARLYRVDGDGASAGTCYRDATRLTLSPDQRREIADYFLDQAALEDAAATIGAMEREKDPQTTILSLQVRLLVAQGEPTKAVELACRVISSAEFGSLQPRAAFAVAREVADALAHGGRVSEGAALLRDVAHQTKHGERPVIEWMSTQPSSWAEALELAFNAAQAGPGVERGAEGATLLAAVLRRGNVSAEQNRRAEELFERALSKPSAAVGPLLLEMAVLREYQGNPREAIRLTEQALETWPENLAHQNNLAWFLAAYGEDPSRALKTIDRVIGNMGPIPELLDTKGVALLAAKRHEEAVRVLDGGSIQPGASASRLLHRVEAYRAAGWLGEADQLAPSLSTQQTRSLPPRDQKRLDRLGASAN